MATKVDSFCNDVTTFISNHQLLCILTLGLAIVGFCASELAGRTVAWIQQCCGSAEKTDAIGQSVLNASGSSQNKQSNRPLSEVTPISANAQANPSNASNGAAHVSTTVKQQTSVITPTPQSKNASVVLSDKQMWEELTKRTKERLRSMVYLTHNEVEHRYLSADFQRGIRCPKKTAIQLEERFLHANEVGRGISQNILVASQTPKEKERLLFWKAIFEGNYTIIDLTTHEDQKADGVKYYPVNVNDKMEFDNFVITLEKVDGFFYHYRVTDGKTTKQVTRYNFFNWIDHKALTVPLLNKLVEDLEKFFGKQAKLWVHCLAGVGRTGTLLTAIILKEKVAEITPETADEYLIKLILSLRDDRGENFVFQPVQYSLLREYCKSLVSSVSSK